ncbi:MAG: two-component system nitrogen regulation response regulator NtrX, partial [Paraglaciecola sp.]
HFLQQLADEYGNAKKVIETDAVKLLESYDWSGNIRELRNVTERLVILSGDKITKGEVERYAVY